MQSERYFADDILNFIFLNEDCCVLIKILLNVFPKGLFEKYPNIGLNNDLAPNRRHAIICTNGCLINWHVLIARSW